MAGRAAQMMWRRLLATAPCRPPWPRRRQRLRIIRGPLERPRRGLPATTLKSVAGRISRL